MVETEVVQNHCIPVVVLQLCCNISCDVVVHFGKILHLSALVLLEVSGPERFHTDTKKLVVPSDRSNVPGKSLSHVSSPYMTTFPVPFAFICASQLSCEARLDVLSVSSRFRIASRKEGIEPVVIALSRGMVTVGDVA
jgi:hypothetical protein